MFAIPGAVGGPGGIPVPPPGANMSARGIGAALRAVRSAVACPYGWPVGV